MTTVLVAMLGAATGAEAAVAGAEATMRMYSRHRALLSQGILLFLISILGIATRPITGATTGLITRAGVTVECYNSQSNAGPVTGFWDAAGSMTEVEGLLHCHQIQKYSFS